MHDNTSAEVSYRSSGLPCGGHYRIRTCEVTSACTSRIPWRGHSPDNTSAAVRFSSELGSNRCLHFGTARMTLCASPSRRQAFLGYGAGVAAETSGITDGYQDSLTVMMECLRILRKVERELDEWRPTIDRFRTPLAAAMVARRTRRNDHTT